MALDIFAIALGVIAVVAGIWGWWYEKRCSDEMQCGEQPEGEEGK